MTDKYKDSYFYVKENEWDQEIWALYVGALAPSDFNRCLTHDFTQLRAVTGTCTNIIYMYICIIYLPTPGMEHLS